MTPAADLIERGAPRRDGVTSLDVGAGGVYQTHYTIRAKEIDEVLDGVGFLNLEITILLTTTITRLGSCLLRRAHPVFPVLVINLILTNYGDFY